MRGKLVFLAVLAMLVGLVYCVGTRTRDAHVMPRPRPDVAPDAGGPSAATTDGTSTADSARSTDAGVAPDALAPLLDRPLRLVASAWEQAATALVANGGQATADGSAVGAVGLDLRVDIAATPQDIDNRLARGGADPEGADVAVLPLPTFVASYERLRALEPQVVHVVGWSRGREVLLGVRDAMLAKPGAFPGDVVVASSDPSATLLALFALDEAGTSASHVRIAPDAKDPVLAALARPLPDDRGAQAPAKVQLTTADASRLVPLIAVAARGFIEGHPSAIRALLQAWVAGGDALRKDVPAAARRIASQPGALEPAVLLERLAWISDPGPRDEALSMGVVGADAVTVEWLFARDWRLLRDAGTLTSPAPSGPIVASSPFARAFPGMSARPSESVAAPDPAARTLLAHRVVTGDTTTVATEVAVLARIFERSVVRVSARPASLAKDAVESATQRYALGSERVVATPVPLAGAGVALIEVLAAP